LVQYDQNNCDEVENQTFYEYQLVGPVYVNTSWSEWYNITSCQPDDKYTQERNLTQHDVYSCAVNLTFYEYQNLSCDYCVPDLVNTTKTEWQNYSSCLITDEQQQNRSWVEYDLNSCEEFDNVTYWDWRNISCDYCIPNRVNITWSDWYFIEGCQIDDTRVQERNWTEYDEHGCYGITGLPSDISENITYFENETTVCDFLTITCEVGGPYQQGALALFIGNVSNYSAVLVGEDVNVSLYRNNFLNVSRVLQTSEDGDFETSFSNLSVGNYEVNASISYLGANETCSEEFQVGNAASLVLDKLANIHNLSETETFYNISLRVLNKGGADCVNTSLSDDDSDDSPYDLGTISPNDILLLSYLKSFTRQNTTSYYSLEIAGVEGIDSYSSSLIFANSTSMNLTIPSISIGKQLVITKNVVFVNEESLNVTYNVSSTLYNSGDENLVGIAYVDTDISGVGIYLNLTKGSLQEFGNLVVIDKAASNIEHEFALGIATVDSELFYSNRPKVNVPGYGGPADLIVDAPETVLPEEVITVVIEIRNMNPDIGQDFVLDYWITNEQEDENYSLGRQTLYVPADGTTNASVELSAPSEVGTYKLMAVVSWTLGSADSFDSFEVVSGGGDDDDDSGDDGSVGGGGTVEEEPEEVGEEGEPEVPEEEPEEEILGEEPEGAIARITGFFVNIPEGGKEVLVVIGPIILIIFLFLILWRILRAFKRKKKKAGLSLKSVRKMKVYTSCGMEIGTVKEIILGENKIDSLRIKLSRKRKSRLKGIIVNYKYVHDVKDVVIVDEGVLEKI